MTDETDGCSCKVGRLAAEYDLTNTDTHLVEEWHDGKSVRALTEELNKDVIRTEMNAANVGQIEWSKTPVYEAIKTDSLNESDEIEIRRELERAGIDVGELSSNLVSHQTVYRHLTNCLDVSKTKDQTPEERRRKARDTVYALQQRTELVTKSTVENLRSADVTEVGDVDVLVDLQIVCSDCGRSMDFEEAITDGCRCGTD